MAVDPSCHVRGLWAVVELAANSDMAAAKTNVLAAAESDGEAFDVFR